MTQWMKPCASRKLCHSSYNCKHAKRHGYDENCPYSPDGICPKCVPEKKGRKK